MTAYQIDKTFFWHGRVCPPRRLTAKVESVLKMFGLDFDSLAESSIRHKCSIEINPGRIVFITGPSGSGKSVLLRELFSICKRGTAVLGCESRNIIDLDSIKLSKTRSVIDCISGNFFEALKTLSIAGLSDVYAVLNTPAHLSQGQQYRFKIAKALSLIASAECTCPVSPQIYPGGQNPANKWRGSLSSGDEPRATNHGIIFSDEFCSTLDRITASVVAYQIRKFATRHNIAFVLASAHQDLLADLQPDIIVIKHLNGQTEVIHKHVQ